MIWLMLLLLLHKETLVRAHEQVSDCPQPAESEYPLDCVLLNGQDFQCSWCSNNQADSPLGTTWQVQYSCGFPGHSGNTCEELELLPSATITSCQLLLAEDCSCADVKIESLQDEQNTSIQQLVFRHHRVKPSPVTNMRFRNITATSVDVLWEPRRDNNFMRMMHHNGRLSYQVNLSLSNDLHPSVWQKSLCTSSTQHHFTELEPYTKYTVHISAIPNPRSYAGVWSDSNTKEFRTHMSAPGRPTVFPGGFKVASNHLYVYWKEPPTQGRNGPLSYYQVQAMFENKSESELIPNTTFTAKFSINENDGVQQAHVKVVNKDPDEQVFYSPAVVIETRACSGWLASTPWQAEVQDDKTLVVWVPHLSPSFTSVTVLQCTPDMATDINICKDSPVITVIDLQGNHDVQGSHDLPGSHQHLHIDMTQRASSVYGVAVNMANSSCGLHPRWLQICFKNLSPGPPQHLTWSRRSSSSVLVTWMRPACPSNRNTNRQFGLAYNYTLRWWPNKDPDDLQEVVVLWTQHNFTITNIEGGQLYTVMVIANGGWGRSTSDSFMFSLKPENSQVTMLICSVIASLLMVIIIIVVLVRCQKRLNKSIQISLPPPGTQDGTDIKAYVSLLLEENSNTSSI